MNKELFLSVIIPVYNLERYIAKTLECLLPQLERDIEVIIVNDGSTDSSLEIVNETVKGCNSNVIIVDQVNSGVSAARNAGIDRSRGKYIYFLDGDDFVSEDLILKIRKKGEFDYLIFGFDTVNEKGELLTAFTSKYIYPKADQSAELVLRDFLLKNFTICIGSSVFNRNIISSNNLKFGEEYAYGEDVSFFAKYMAHTKSIKVIKESLMFYLIHGNSAMSRNTKPNYVTIRALEEVYNYLLDNGINKKVARVCYSCMITGSILAQNIRAAGNGLSYSKELLPGNIKKKLAKINFYDCLVLKKKRGLGLYLGCKILYRATPVFYFVVQFGKLRYKVR